MGWFDSLFESDIEDEARNRSYAWGPTQQGLVTGAGTIADWMGRSLEQFPGQTYADFTPAQLQALEQMKAGGGVAPFLPTMTGAWETQLGRPEDVLGMGLQDVASNPYLAGIADVMESRSQERMLEDVLPQMRADAIGAGGLGGSRLAVNAQQAERDRQRALDEALAGLYGQAWQSGLGAETSRYNQALAGATSALGQTPAILSAVQIPTQQLMAAGSMEQAQEQRAIDEAVARHEFDVYEPHTRATMGMSALMSPAQAFGTRETRGRRTSTPSVFSQLGSMLSLGGGLMGLGGGLMGLAGGMGPFGGGAPMPAGTPFGGYGGMGSLPSGWGVSPTYGMADPWGGATTYGMWG